MTEILRVGRLTVNAASAGMTSGRSAETVTLEGDLCGSPEIADLGDNDPARPRAVALLAHSITGLSDGEDPFIAVVGTDDKSWDHSLDGVYRVDDASVDVGGESLRTASVPWSITLSRVDHRPLMEHLVSWSQIANQASQVGQPMIALPSTAAGNRVDAWSWAITTPERSTTSFATPLGTDAKLLARSQGYVFPASGIVRDTWSVPPDAWMLGAAQIAIPVGATSIPLVGRRWPGWIDAPLVGVTPLWSIDNGLIRFSAVLNGGAVAFRLECFRDEITGWMAPYDFFLARGTATTDRWNRIAAIRVVRNNPFEVALELDMAQNAGLTNAHLAGRRDTVTVRLQRGRHHVAMSCRSEVAHVWDLRRATADAASAINTAAMVDTTSASGWGWVMSCAETHATTLASGVKTTSAAQTIAQFALGAQTANGSFDVRPSALEIAQNMFADVYERHRPLGHPR